MLAFIFPKFQKSTSFYPFQIWKLSSKGDVGFYHWLVSSFLHWNTISRSSLSKIVTRVCNLSSSGTLVAKGKRETMGTRLHFTILTQLVLFSPSVVTPQLSLFSSDKIELATSKIFYEKKDWLNRIHVQNVVQYAKFQNCRRVSFLLQRNTWYDFIESPHFRLPHLCTNNASMLIYPSSIPSSPSPLFFDFVCFLSASCHWLRLFQEFPEWLWCPRHSEFLG